MPEHFLQNSICSCGKKVGKLCKGKEFLPYRATREIDGNMGCKEQVIIDDAMDLKGSLESLWNQRENCVLKYKIVYIQQ